MSTTASFVNADPPCPTQVFTRAELIALRDAGSLRIDCHYRWVGPVIGTPGNTSPTIIESHAVQPGELSQNVSVDTEFASSTGESWAGLADIDLGTAGTITRLADSWGNVVSDPDADAPTVQSTFPWHRGSSTFRDNEVQDSTLTGWDVGTAFVNGNRIVRSTVDLSGGWTFQNNAITGGTVTLQATAGAVRSFSGNTVKGAAVFRADVSAGGSLNIADNEILDGYVVEIAAANGANVTVDGHRFDGHIGAPTAIDCLIGADAGTVTFGNGRSVPTALQQYSILGAGGSVAVSADVFGGRIIRDAAATANLTLGLGSRVQGVVTQGPGATGGALVIQNSDVMAPGTVVNHLGPGSISILTSVLQGGGVTLSAGATRGLGFTSTTLQAGTVVQNRTGGTGVDQFSNSFVEGQGNVVTLNGAADPGGNQTILNSSRVHGLSFLTLTDPVGTAQPTSVVLQQTEVSAGSSVTGTGTLLVQDCRFSAGCNVELGAFTHDSTVVEGGFVRTLTGPNSNRRLTKSFDDLIGV